MAQVQSIPITIGYAKICQYLSANSVAKNSVLSWDVPNFNIQQEIYMERKAIEWAYGNNPNNTTLPLAAQYLYSLCGQYLSQAEIISGNTSGQIVNPSTGAVSTIQFFLLQFEIGATGSLMNAGNTSLVLNFPYINQKSVFVNYGGVALPITTTDTIGQQTFSVVYGTNNSTLTFQYPVKNGDLITIAGSYLVTI